MPGNMSNTSGGVKSEDDMSLISRFVTREEAYAITHAESSKIAQGINAFIEFFTGMYNKGIDVINSTPTIIHDNTLQVSDVIAGKLKAIGDAVRGSDESAAQNDYTVLNKKHFDLLEKMRKQDIVMYKNLVTLAQQFRGEPVSVQYVKLKEFFNITSA